MEVQLWSIGKASNAYAEEGAQLFMKRLKHYTDFNFRIIPPVKNSANLTVSELKAQEGKLILSLLNDNDYLVALDENGKLLTTGLLADFINQRNNAATRKIVFLIGGAFGLDKIVLDKADYILSLSPLTFPHQLVRLIMMEQLYRVYTILHNEKYHHQ